MKTKAPAREPQFRHVGFAVLRTPLLPFDQFAHWSAASMAAANAQAGPDIALKGTTDEVGESLECLRRFVSKPEFIDAVRVASPSLHSALGDWLAGRSRPDLRRLEQSLIRYLSRASNRPTPFGLFAGCSLMTVGDVTALELCPMSHYTRRSRIDMDHLAELTRVIMSDDDARRRLPLYANPNAPLLGGRLHYVETRYEGRFRRYALTAVETSPEIMAVLSRAEHGVSYDELVEVLRASGFEDDEIQAFLTELLDCQLLSPGIEPQLTGNEAASVLADDLLGAAHAHDVSDALRSVNASLESIDKGGVGTAPERYDLALSPLQALSVPVDPSKILQVDLFKPSARLSLSKSVVDDVIVAAELLHSLAIRIDPLAEFADRFSERYETREVPLLEALDDEVGIGFPDVASNDRLVRSLGDRLRQREAWLAELRARAARSNAPSVELLDTDIARLRSPDRQVPADAIGVLATLLASSGGNVNAGGYQLLIHGVAGPSGARMLGRFAHLDPHLESSIRNYFSCEEALSPDAVFAEIIHLPQGRIGNVVARPVLRDYEIAYLGRGGAGRAKQIHLSDLVVSVQAGRVFVRSLSLDRRVVPRLTSAHNYSSQRELPAYRFLATLQDHGVTGASSWSWGAQGAATSLPRVTRGRLVLSRASWTFDVDEVGTKSPNQPAARRAFAHWCEAWSVPRYVEFVDGDNRMPVDIANPRSVEALLQLMRGRQVVTLHEMLQIPGSLCVHGPEGSFTNEIVVPLIRISASSLDSTTTRTEPRARHLRTAASKVTRRYPPGSEWVYAKLYCGKGSGDLVLRSVIAPLVAKGLGEGLIKKWFFVRYFDPTFHIRLRVCGTDGQIGRLLELVGSECTEYVANGRIARLTFDTYQPEVERYGGAGGIEIAETMFQCDSVAALSIVSGVSGENVSSVADRETLALSGIERYFADACIGVPERVMLLDRFLRNTVPSVRRHRSANYRARRSAVSEAVAASRAPAAQPWLTEILDTRSIHSQALFSEFRAAESRNELMAAVEEVFFSFTHMWINRVWGPAPGVEANLYDMLQRHYFSELARASAAHQETAPTSPPEKAID